MDIGKTYRFWGRCSLRLTAIDTEILWFEHVKGEHTFEATHGGRIPISIYVIEQGIKTGAIRWIQSTK